MLEYLSLLTTWPSLIIIGSMIIYFYSKRNHNYWRSRGINGPEPLPFIGTIYQLFKKPICLQDLDNYRKFGRIYGVYEGYKPVLFLAEPELIRDVYVKDFSSFVDRGTDSFGHPMFDRSLLLARGDQWKQLRVIVSPTFSSSKMRKMKFLIETCVERLDQAMEKLLNTEIDVRKMMSNYSMDVIALCAFATKLDTHKTDGELHPFVKNANVFFTPSPRFGLFFILNAMAPYLIRTFNIAFVPSYVYNYFEKILKQIISERQSLKGSKNLDLLQHLIDAKNKTDSKDIDEDIKQEVQQISQSMQKNKFKLEEIDILSTSLFFLLGGSETTSSTLAYMFHELALHPEYQQKLYQEINSCGDKQDYDTISQLPYLDACVSETLRKYPPLVQNQRTATDDYELGTTRIKIPKLMSIMVPVYAMHHDPQYFPDPEEYKPDRFMPENKSQIIPYTYLPFGTGPRNCVGMRFALMNIKTAAVHILSKYRFIKTPNTVTNFEYKKFVVFTQAVDMGTVILELRK